MVAPRATQRSATPTFGIDTALTTPTWGWFSVPGATLRARPNHGMNSAGRLFRLLLPPLEISIARTSALPWLRANARYISTARCASARLAVVGQC
jgi:hypothetical protein